MGRNGGGSFFLRNTRKKNRPHFFHEWQWRECLRHGAIDFYLQWRMAIAMHGCLLSDFPAGQLSGGGVKRDADFVQLSGIGGKRQGVILAVDLGKRVFRCVVTLKFKQVDIVPCFHLAVNAAGKCVHFAHGELSEQRKDEVDDRLKIMLKGILPDRVSDIRKERCQDIFYLLQFSPFDIAP